MRALLCLIVVLGVLGTPVIAGACKCGKVDERKLAEDYTVFVGTAVEYLARKGEGGDAAHQGPIMDAVTRFEVQYARDVRVGSSVTVAVDGSSSCGTSFTVGERYLVTARKLGKLLHVNECPWLRDELEKKLLTQLGVPAGFLPSRSPKRKIKPLSCEHPRTLDQAFRAADAIGWWTPKASCVVPGSTMTEHAAVTRWGWKGLRQGDVLLLRIAGRLDEPAPPPFEGELSDETRMSWPPADFLRRDGDAFINDGCLIPLAPTSLEAASEAVQRLFPLPADYPRTHREPSHALPTPSCMTLDQSYFASAEAAAALYFQSYEVQSELELRRLPQTPRREGSCAGCALAPPDDPAPLSLLAVALATLARRRRR